MLLSYCFPPESPKAEKWLESNLRSEANLRTRTGANVIKLFTSVIYGLS